MTRSTLIIASVFVSVCGSVPLAAQASMRASETSDRSIWRAPHLDGVNSLYTHLRSRGHNVNYDNLRATAESTGCANLTQLVEIARIHDMRLKPARLTEAELLQLRSPVIIHLEPEGERSGGFSLFLFQRPESRTVGILDGATLTPYELGIDSFRRAWTGFALTGESNSDPISRIRRWVAVAFAVVLGCLVLVHARAISASKERENVA